MEIFTMGVRSVERACQSQSINDSSKIDWSPSWVSPYCKSPHQAFSILTVRPQAVASLKESKLRRGLADEAPGDIRDITSGSSVPNVAYRGVTSAAHIWKAKCQRKLNLRRPE